MAQDKAGGSASGHRKESGFYPKSNRTVVKGVKQESDLIEHKLLKAHPACSVNDGLEGGSNTGRQQKDPIRKGFCSHLIKR